MRFKHEQSQSVHQYWARIVDAQSQSIHQYLAQMPVLALCAHFACTASAPMHIAKLSGDTTILDEKFSDLHRLPVAWIATGLESRGATITEDDHALRLTLPSSGEIRLVRSLDVALARGARVRISAKVRTSSSTAMAVVSLSSGSASSDYRERLRLQSGPDNDWASLTALVDIEPASVRLDVSLALSGQGSAWFDRVTVAKVDPIQEISGATISPTQIQNVAVLARAAALIRHRHPADQSATLDWDAFLPGAIEQVMHTRDRRELLGELRALFKQIAPTVEFTEEAVHSLAGLEPKPGNHLSRWRHVGMGSVLPSASWREGRDADQASVRLEVLLDVPNLRRCKKARLRVNGRRTGDRGEALMYADIGLPGTGSKEIDGKLDPDESVVSEEFDMPADAYNVRIGVRLKGRAGFSLSAISFTCDGHEYVTTDVGKLDWIRRGMESMYTFDIADCASGKCVVAERKPLDMAFVSERDMLSTQIGDRLWVHIPLAVWTDGERTFPEVNVSRLSPMYAATDLPTRLAIVSAAWGLLSSFYPYFVDQRIDWSRELTPGLARAAAARSIPDMYDALFGLLVASRDSHARAYHSSVRVDGLLPVALRHLAGSLFVVGGLSDYMERLPVGSTILAIDGVAASQAYNDMMRRVPAATAAWSEAIVPYWLTVGPVGVLSVLRIKTPGGKTDDLVLPHVSRTSYEQLVREPRPATGTELTSGVYYVDLDGLTSEHWRSALASLSRARLIIMDMRGYPTSAAFDILGHLSKQELRSPEWLMPSLETSDYVASFWTIRPMVPKLDAKVIVLVDGRSISAAETVLQLVQDNHLAILVGEASAGTNGNVHVVPLPGGFSIRFTGMRVARPDGTVVQGRGIVPDHVVHPTLEGLRNGRDEILEAALELGKRL